jgi:hypothetical protein
LIDSTGAQNMSVNCAKLKSCNRDSVCQCDAAGCTAAAQSSFDFDLRFTGDTGEGSSTSALGPRAHFTRVP